MEEKGRITENDLMHRLVAAKKIMNKVDSGDYQTGNIDESMLMSGEDIDYSNDNIDFNEPVVNTRPVGNPSVDKIHQSRLPDNIKKAMLENPIQQMTLNDTMDMSFVQGAKKLMEREGMITKKSTKPQSFHQQRVNEQVQQKSSLPINNSDLVTILTPIVENAVRKIMDEKLTQILTAQQTMSINENLVLKVGDSIFKGKITGVNKSK